MPSNPLSRDSVRPRAHYAVPAVDPRLEPCDALAPVGDTGAGRQVAGVEARVEIGGMVVRDGVGSCREGEGGEGEDRRKVHCWCWCLGFGLSVVDIEGWSMMSWPAY